jgi:hypothetical protein
MPGDRLFCALGGEQPGSGWELIRPVRIFPIGRPSERQGALVAQIGPSRVANNATIEIRP